MLLKVSLISNLIILNLISNFFFTFRLLNLDLFYEQTNVSKVVLTLELSLICLEQNLMVIQFYLKFKY